MATEKAKAPIKFRPHNWINTSTKTVRLGVQARVDGKWINVGSPKAKCFTPKFFRTEESRSAWIAKENARHKAMTRPARTGGPSQ